jgi:hypothetical protein
MIGSCSLRVDYKHGAKPTRDFAATAETGSIASYGGGGGRGYDDTQGDRFGRGVAAPRNRPERGSYGDRSPHAASRDEQHGNGIVRDCGSSPTRYQHAGSKGGDRSGYDRGAVNDYGVYDSGTYGDGCVNGNGHASGRGGYGDNGGGGGGRYAGNDSNKYADAGGCGRGYGGGNGGKRGYDGGNCGGYAGGSAPRESSRHREDRSCGSAPPPYQHEYRGARPANPSYYR